MLKFMQILLVFSSLVYITDSYPNRLDRFYASKLEKLAPTD